MLPCGVIDALPHECTVHQLPSSVCHAMAPPIMVACFWFIQTVCASVCLPKHKQALLLLCPLSPLLDGMLYKAWPIYLVFRDNYFL